MFLMSDNFQSDMNSEDEYFDSYDPEQEQSVWDGESTQQTESADDNWNPETSADSDQVTMNKPADGDSSSSEKEDSSQSTEKEEWEEWEDENYGQSVDEDLVKQQQEKEQAASGSQTCQSSTEDTWDYTKPVWAQTDSDSSTPNQEIESVDEEYLLNKRTTYNAAVYNDTLGPRQFFEEIDQGGHGRIHYCWRNDFVERTVGTSGCLPVSIVMVLHYYNFMSNCTIKQKIESLVQFMRGYKRSQNIISKPKHLPTYDYITPDANPRTEKLLADIPLYTADKFVASIVCSDQNKLARYQKFGIEAIDSNYLSPFEIVTKKGGKLIFSTKGGVKGGLDINGKEVTSLKEPSKGYMPNGHFVVISGYNSSGMFEIADPAGDRKGAGDLAFVDPEIIKDKTFIWIKPSEDTTPIDLNDDNDIIGNHKTIDQLSEDEIIDGIVDIDVILDKLETFFQYLLNKSEKLKNADETITGGIESLADFLGIDLKAVEDAGSDIFRRFLEYIKDKTVENLELKEKIKFLKNFLEFVKYRFDYEQRIFFTTTEAYQQYFGYADIYDEHANDDPVFRIDWFKVYIYAHNEKGDLQTYAIRGWKGNYWSAAGAEIGCYTGDNPVVKALTGEDATAAPKSFMLKMGFILEDENGNEIFRRYKEENWWVIGLKPGQNEVWEDARGKYTMKGVIDFEGKAELADSFESEVEQHFEKSDTAGPISITKRKGNKFIFLWK